MELESETMEVLNKTGFMLAPFVGRIGFPGHSLTLIIKGIFNLKPGEKAVLSEKQLFPTGSELYEDDKEGTGSHRYDSDFAYFKPRSDLLLVGKCHSPGNKPVQACRVSFHVGDTSKSLGIIGNRYRQGTFSTISEPELFTELDLRYENSYGGEGCKNNPVGKSYTTEQKEGESSQGLLPNVEAIQHHSQPVDVNAEPAGFGPLGNMWHTRFSKTGTYKGAWLKERWPWFPKDFDWGYFNAAPSDMQVEGYLKGDEALFFENLHPTHSQYRSQLPGVRIRLFVNTCHKDSSNDPQFKEVSVNLDTLWVDMEAEKLVLVWRGLTAVQSEEYEEIQHIYIAKERLGEAAKPVDYFHDLFLQELVEEDEIYEIKPLVDEKIEDNVNLENELAKSEALMRASLLEAGINPDNLPAPTPEQKAEEARLLKELGIEFEIEAQPLTRETFMERVKKGEDFIGEDLRGLDLSELDIKAINLQSAIISGVCLKNADLSGAKLSEVDLSRADLSNVNLKGAILKDADLTDANLNGADLTGALLDDAIFEKANLGSALLDEVSAINTIFSKANLAKARLINSTLEGADFSKCNLQRANLHGANLCEASVEGASGKEVNMTEADLTGLCASGGCDFPNGHFGKTKGKESIWEGANLANADFSYSSMEGADFTSADLTLANFSAANMKFARFTNASLQEAKFIQMNLFQGSLEKANLTRTDLRGSNLYAAEFLDAIISETEFEFSNLQMTKLSKG